MPKINFINLVVLPLLLAATTNTQTVSAQTSKPSANGVGANLQTPEWINEKWNADDKPYLRVQSGVDAELAKTKSKSQSVANYRKAWAQDSADPLKFFRYAYGKYQLLPRSGNDLVRQLSGLATEFAKVSSPGSYHYSRLHFLVESRNFANPQFKPLAKRLIEKDKQDADVLYYSLNLWNVADAADRKLALSATQALLKTEPNRPSTQAAAGWVEYRIWLVTNQKSSAQAAAQHYKRYLQLAPVTDSFRPQAQRIIAQLEKA